MAASVERNWSEFDLILAMALGLWPRSVILSPGNGSGGFSAYEYKWAIERHYIADPDHLHIVRQMSWAILCALPRDFQGEFVISNVDKDQVKKHFERQVLSDVASGEADEMQVAYFRANIEGNSA